MSEADHFGVGVQEQVIMNALGSAMVAFGNLELNLMNFFAYLLGIPQFNVSLAIWESAMFRDKLSMVHKLVSIRIEKPDTLTVWNGVKRAQPEQGIKGLYGHLQSAGEKRNKLAHSILGGFSEAGKPMVMRLIPNLSNDSIKFTSEDIRKSRDYFKELTSVIGWVQFSCLKFDLPPGKPQPTFPEPTPDLVHRLLSASSQNPTAPPPPPQSSEG